jgi:hypothetical protein
VKKLIFVFIVGVSPISWALDFTPEGIYYATKEVCSANPEKVLFSGAVFDKANAGQFSKKEFTDLIDAIKRGSNLEALKKGSFTSRHLFAETLYISPEFKKALLECYPENSRAFKFFYETVLRADYSGKLVAGAIIVSAIRFASLTTDGFVSVFSRLSNININSVRFWTETSLLTTMLASDSAPDQEKSNQLTGNDLLRALDNSRILEASDSRASMRFLLKASQNRLDVQLSKLKTEVNPTEIQKINRSIETLQASIESLKLAMDSQ